MRSTFPLLGLVVFSFFSMSAQAAKPVLRVGISGELAPLHGQDKGGWVGLEPDLARALGKHLGRQVEFVDLAAIDRSSFDALKDKSVDVSLNSLTASAPAEQGTALTVPYAELKVRLAAKNNKKLDSLDQAQGRVGVLDRATRDLVAKAMPGVDVVPQHSLKEAIVALMRGQLAYVAHDAAVLRAAIKDTNLQILPQDLGSLHLVMAVRSDEKDAFDAALSKLDKSLGELQARWLATTAVVGDVPSPLATLPAGWVELTNRKGKMIIPVYCSAATARIKLSQRDGGWYIEFDLGEDSVEGRVGKVEELGKGHWRIHYLEQSIELRYRAGSKTAEWGKSSELWKGGWRTFADAAHEDDYGAYRVEECPEATTGK
ncbi:MAG: transporter substrate-binding domain-containing protein [Pseudomonadota bacterium]